MPCVSMGLAHMTPYPAHSVDDFSCMDSPINPIVDFLVVGQKLQNFINYSYDIGLRRFNRRWNQNK